MGPGEMTAALEKRYFTAGMSGGNVLACDHRALSLFNEWFACAYGWRGRTGEWKSPSELQEGSRNTRDCKRLTGSF
jgi:hypothetical protein